MVSQYPYLQTIIIVSEYAKQIQGESGMYNIGPIKTVLEKSGYREVVIEESMPPEHVLEFAKGDDAEITAEEISEVMPYFKVKTAQGSFGIVVGAYILIDTKGSGCDARSLGDTDAPEDTYLISLNTLTLKSLRRLFETTKH